MAMGMQDVPWHLDRLDQANLPLNLQYLPVAEGKDVDIYILDSGINFSHEEFENRAKYSGSDPMDQYNAERREGMDCHGHGTHVASLAAGRTFGVAKEARLYSVRVLNCDNTAPWSVILNGLDYVSRVIPERGRPAIVSLSLSGNYFRTVDLAMRELYDQGIFSVSAAGNARVDACTATPASSAFTVTVGGTREGDGIYTFTNFGSCVDIFAPGQNVRGADWNCNTCSKFLSGTSMSTPMVSGVAAILLSQEPLLSPNALKNKLLDSAVRNKLNFRDIPSTHRDNTDNIFLHVTGQCGGHHTLPVTLVSPNFPQNYPHNLQSCQWVLATPEEGGMVECVFLDFSTEANYDTVTLCDGGSCCPSSVIASLSGDMGNVTPYLSSERNMTIQMTSDGIISQSGFRVSCYSRGNAPPVTSTLPPPITVPPITAPPITTSPITTSPITTSPITTPPITTHSIITPPPTTDIETTGTAYFSIKLI